MNESVAPDISNDTPPSDTPPGGGMLEEGNIDLHNRPVVHNPDGTVSTELSFSRGTDNGEVLVPRVVGGQVLSEDDAWKHYKDTGEHLGIFPDADTANSYADALHHRNDAPANLDITAPPKWEDTVAAPDQAPEPHHLDITAPPTWDDTVGLDADPHALFSLGHKDAAVQAYRAQNPDPTLGALIEQGAGLAGHAAVAGPKMLLEGIRHIADLNTDTNTLAKIYTNFIAPPLGFVDDTMKGMIDETLRGIPLEQNTPALRSLLALKAMEQTFKDQTGAAIHNTSLLHKAIVNQFAGKVVQPSTDDDIKLKLLADNEHTKAFDDLKKGDLRSLWGDPTLPSPEAIQANPDINPEREIQKGQMALYTLEGSATAPLMGPVASLVGDMVADSVPYLARGAEALVGGGLEATGAAAKGAGSLLNASTKYVGHYYRTYSAISLFHGNPIPLIVDAGIHVAKKALPPLGRAVAAGGEKLTLGTEAVKTAAPYLGKALGAEAQGMTHLLPFAATSSTPEEAQSALDLGSAMGFMGATMAGSRSVLMDAIAKTPGGPHIQFSTDPFDYGMDKMTDDAHNNETATWSSDNISMMNRQRHAMRGSAEIYALNPEDYHRIVGKDNSYGVKDAKDGSTIIYYNGETGFENAKMHEPGHVIFDGMDDLAKQKFEKSMLRNNDPSKWASRYYSALERKPVTIDYDKLDWSKPDAQGRTKKAVLSEMAADAFNNFSFDKITQDPHLIRSLQLGVGRFFEAMGMPMTPREMQGVLGVQPSAGAIAMLEGVLRDVVKRNQAHEKHAAMNPEGTPDMARFTGEGGEVPNFVMQPPRALPPAPVRLGLPAPEVAGPGIAGLEPQGPVGIPAIIPATYVPDAGNHFAALVNDLKNSGLGFTKTEAKAKAQAAIDQARALGVPVEYKDLFKAALSGSMPKNVMEMAVKPPELQKKNLTKGTSPPDEPVPQGYVRFPDGEVVKARDESGNYSKEFLSQSAKQVRQASAEQGALQTPDELTRQVADSPSAAPEIRAQSAAPDVKKAPPQKPSSAKEATGGLTEEEQTILDLRKKEQENEARATGSDQYPPAEKEVPPYEPPLRSPAIRIEQGAQRGQIYHGSNWADAIKKARKAGADISGLTKGFSDINKNFLDQDQALDYGQRIGQIPDKVKDLTPDRFQMTRQFMPKTGEPATMRGFHATDREIKDGLNPDTWFTDNHKAADFYYSGDELGKKHEAHVTFKNPLVVSPEEFKSTTHGPPYWLDKAYEQGHDGVIVRDIIDGDTQSTVFAPIIPKGSDPHEFFSSERIKPIGQSFMPKDHPDAIKEAAIRLPDGTLLTGITHWNAAGANFIPEDAQLGFVNNKGEFRDRFQAEEDAARVGQLQHDSQDGLEAQDFEDTRRFMPKIPDTPEFKKWFEDSQITDEQGRPLAVYHGTNQDFSDFSPQKGGLMTGSKSAEHGLFFTDSPEVASDYASYAARRLIAGSDEAHDAKVGDLLQQINNAERKRDFDTAERLTQELEDLDLGARRDTESGQVVIPAFLSMKNPLRIDAKDIHPSDVKLEEAIRQAKSEGRDGVIIQNTTDNPSLGGVESNHYVVFDPSQIESATAPRTGRQLPQEAQDYMDSLRTPSSGLDRHIGMQFMPKPHDPEAIKEAAIRMSDGMIFTAPTHGQAASQASDAMYTYSQISKSRAGFIDNGGSFLTRKQAEERAAKVGQLQYDSQEGLEAEDFSATRRFMPKEGDRWYHGTNEDLKPGDIIKPGQVTGMQAHSTSSDQHAWISSDPWRAGAYGHKTYEVEPLDTPAKRHGAADEFTTGQARIVREVPTEEARALSQSYQSGIPKDKISEGLQKELVAAKLKHYGFLRAAVPDIEDKKAAPELP